MAKLVCGIGYTGKGRFNHLDRKLSNLWNQMIKRCYAPLPHQEMPYADISVCEDWLNYQNFCEWVVNQKYYSVFEIDKDWRIIGNKEYSPNACSFIPHAINSAVKGNGWRLHRNAWIVLDAETRRQLFRSHDEASAKEFWINNTKIKLKVLADAYKNMIHEDVYYNLVNWNG